MQKFILWWCDFVGVTDPNAIQIAIGVSAAGALLLVILFIFNGVFWSLGASVKPGGPRQNSN
jgi:hypothetical protein